MRKNNECKGLLKVLEEKSEEQINNGNEAENVLKAVFDKFGIVYEYKHIELIVDCEGK